MQEEGSSVFDKIREQETHIQEMRHQVKNDFNMISSIMLLQSELAKDKPEMYEILQENMNRIKVIGLLYEQAYHHHKADYIALQGYVTAIVHTLQNTYATLSKTIYIDVHIEDIVLHIEKAQACGLIIHEALTNSLKHAFTPMQEGNIVLSIAQTGPQIILEVNDNGKGLPSGFNIDQASSLGMQLIKSFSGQLNAMLKIISTTGTGLRLVFDA